MNVNAKLLTIQQQHHQQIINTANTFRSYTNNISKYNAKHCPKFQGNLGLSQFKTVQSETSPNKAMAMSKHQQNDNDDDDSKHQQNNGMFVYYFYFTQIRNIYIQIHDLFSLI